MRFGTVFVMLAATACGGPGAAPESSSSSEERVFRSLVLQGPLNPRRGVAERYVVTNAPPGASVLLWVSPDINGPGVTFARQGLRLDIAAPTSHRLSAVADRNGRVEFDLTLNGPVGKQYEMQAMVVNLPNNTHLLSAAPIVRVAPPPPVAAPCTLTFDATFGTASDYTRTGSCDLLVDGPMAAVLVFRDAPIDLFTFDLEASAAWAGFVAGGGTSLGIFSLDGVPLAAGSTGTFVDFSGLNAAGFGSSEWKGTSTFQFDAVDPATATFEMSGSVDMQAYSPVFPPPTDPNDPGQVDLGMSIATGTETGTFTISGGYTAVLMP